MQCVCSVRYMQCACSVRYVQCACSVCVSVCVVCMCSACAAREHSSLLLGVARVQFFHGFMEHGFPVLNLYVVACNYLQSWFLMDLLSSVPFSSLPNSPGGRGPAIGRGAIGRGPVRAHPGDGDAQCCFSAGGAAAVTAESGVVAPAGGVDAAALHALMQQMSAGVTSLNTRLGDIEKRMDGEGKQGS